MKLKALKTEQWLNNCKRNFWKLSSLEGTRVWHYFSTRTFTLIFFERHLRNNLVFKKVSIRCLNIMECIPGLGVSLGNLEWGSIFLGLISLNNGHTYSGPGSSFVHAVSEEKDTSYTFVDMQPLELNTQCTGWKGLHVLHMCSRLSAVRSSWVK